MIEATVLGPRGLRLATGIALRRRERARGLIGRGPAPGRALLIPWAASIHTFGMRVPITVASLDDELVVVSVRRAPPGRVVRPAGPHVLECGVAADVRIGDRLRLVWPGAAASDQEGAQQPEGEERDRGQQPDGDRGRETDP
jgi:hypothetical protein